MKNKEMKYKWIWLIVIAFAGLGIDIFTKYLAQKYLIMGNPINVISDKFQFLLVYNKGALFGFNPKSFIPSFPVNQFFFIFSCIAMVILIVYYWKIPKEKISMHWGLALVLPGAMGNLFDRIVHPNMGVVDFIKVGISQDVYWPIFNFADIYVSVGVAIMMYCFIKDEQKDKKNVKSINGNVAVEIDGKDCPES